MSSSPHANNDVPDDIAEILFKYATFLADQGLFVSAAKYCR